MQSIKTKGAQVWALKSSARIDVDPLRNSCPSLFLVLVLACMMLLPPGRLAGQGATSSPSPVDQAVNGSTHVDMVVYQSIPLVARWHGIHGTLRLTQDSRLLEAHRQVLWNLGDVDFLIGSGRVKAADPLWQPLQSPPLRNAELELTTADGNVLFREVLGRPLARLEGVRLYETDQPDFMVTVDHTAGMGAYNGPIATIAEVRDGAIYWLAAAKKGKGTGKRIALMKSLRTDWQLSPASGGKGQDILYVECRPAARGGDLKTSRTRFAFNGRRWVRRTQLSEGCWESEREFPPPESFP